MTSVSKCKRHLFPSHLFPDSWFQTPVSQKLIVLHILISKKKHNSIENLFNSFFFDSLNKSSRNHLLSRSLVFFSFTFWTRMQISNTKIESFNKHHGLHPRTHKYPKETSFAVDYDRDHRHSDLVCRIVSKKDFQTSFFGKEHLIAWHL